MRTSIPTTVYGTAYLTVAWKNRGNLQNYERYGFGQFMYLTICAHLESVFAELIQKRLKSITYMVRGDTLPEMKYTEDEKIHFCNLEPVYESILQVAASLSSQSDIAPLNKLIELYDTVFSLSLKEVVGEELHQDISALTKLRNLFAHGRDLFLDFESLTDDPFKEAIATLDKNPLQAPALRLHRVGILKDLQITGTNHVDFTAILYSDEALLYFYHAVKKNRREANRKCKFFTGERHVGFA